MKSRLSLVSLFIAALCLLKFAASTPVPDPWYVSGLKTLESGQEQTKQKPVARKMKLMQLMPVIEQVLPQEPDGKPTAYPGSLLTITGKNFAPDTNVTRVLLEQRVEFVPGTPSFKMIGDLYMKSATGEKLEAMIPLTVEPGEYWISVAVGPDARSASVALSVRKKVAPPTGPIPLIFSVYQAVPGMVATIQGSGFGPKTLVWFKSAMSSQDPISVDASTIRVRVPPELKPGPSELQVEVNYLQSAWFPIELQRPMPLSLYWNDTDDNGSPLNPKWGWQVERSFGAPDYYPAPHELVPNTISPFIPFLGPIPQYTAEGFATATDWPVSFDDGGWRHAWCGPHVNWMPATYIGKIVWSDHATDDDYCYWLFPDEGAGATFRGDDNIGGIMVEHDSDETIDHFSTAWWTDFHQAVDHDNAKATEMIREKLAIVSGLMGLDCQHECQSELHPVWLMAIRVEQQGQDEKWAMFARNWGNEGWCGVNQHPVWFVEDAGMYRAELRLPWRPGATSVQFVDWEFETRKDEPADGPSFTPDTGSGVRVTWWLPHPDKRSWSNGWLKLRWTGGDQPFSLSTASVLAANATGAKFDEEAEVIAQMRAALPEGARLVFDQQMSVMRSKSPRVAGVQPPRSTRDASRAIKPQRPPTSIAQPDNVELERTRQMQRAMAEVGVTAMPRAEAAKTAVTQDLRVTSSIIRAAVPLDISGTWHSNIGLTYELRQSGGRFTWTVDGADETAEGTLDGQALSVSWTGRARGKNSATGKITAKDEKGRATRIEWDNRVVFFR